MDKKVKEYLSTIGAKGGAKSKGGGRPRAPDNQLTEAQRKKRARNERYLQKKKQQQNTTE